MKKKKKKITNTSTFNCTIYKSINISIKRTNDIYSCQQHEITMMLAGNTDKGPKKYLCHL